MLYNAFKLADHASEAGALRPELDVSWTIFIVYPQKYKNCSTLDPPIFLQADTNLAAKER
jgi:hypothetical protein